ncbi:uncharacterized protein DUF1566 [Rhodovulum bhavnagarense]|uniref:Uncharacterized protein DUF1566 n=2 Tax=Rhodovulum bhavnagarense TaxID=992286 RepID=A0A4V2SVG4_9RHOB|nr:uncharacterized protein DUF1566 [Rhodovulum bhavnagarense]
MEHCTDSSPGTAATCQTGEDNTALIVGATSSTDYPFEAAVYCDGLSAHGYDDWYLPAQDELNVLYTNRTTGDLNGTFDESDPFPAGYYWSSSETFLTSARSQNFSDGIQGGTSKNSGLAVRCVRSLKCTSPEAPMGAVIYNEDEDVFQGCTLKGWWAFHEYPTNPCTGTTSDPSIGETCEDGSIYAGLSPDGDLPMYTTPADAPSLYTWNDSTSNYSDMPTENCTDGYGEPGTAVTCQTGESNTAFLVGATGAPDYPFAAAEYCDGLSTHGHNDWYLPATDELSVLYINKNTGDLNGTFDETGVVPDSYYWSSSESGTNFARYQIFDDGSQGGTTKNAGISVRCVRKEG